MNFRHLAINRIAYLKLAAIAGFFLLVAFFVFFLWNYLSAPVTINDEVKDFQKAGENALSDLATLPVVNLLEEGESYVIQDNLDEGIEITYPNQVGESVEAKKLKTKINLPKDYAKPIEIKLDEERTIFLQDDNGEGYTSDVLDSANGKPSQSAIGAGRENATLLQKIFGLNKGESQQSYLRYQNGRKSILYSYQRDRATGERKLKNFIFYEKGNGEEQESYTVENARLEKNDNGDVALYYQTDQDLKNQAAAKEVDPSLMDRAMKTLEKEGMNNSQKSPDLLIPKPYYYDKDGNYEEAEWEVQDNKLTLSIKTAEDKYPLAVDPTLAFTAPGVANGGTSIVGETTSDAFGTTLATGDLNTDGKTDLIVASTGYSTNTGRVYVFYNDGDYASRGYAADLSITGEATSNYFGTSLITGDFNADGKQDLAVGARGYSSNTGRVYMFYNDGSIPATAATADAIMTGQTTSNYFGYALATADLNADTKTDLIASAYGYAVTFGTGRVYAFYNGSITTENASAADLFITASLAGNSSFGITLATGDLNADGKIDIAVGGYEYSGSNGQVDLFYNDGSIPTSAGSADVTIAGTTNTDFGQSLATGDMDGDGKTDLVATSSDSVSILRNDGSYPSAGYLGDYTFDTNGASKVATGDFNGDGKTDVVVGTESDASNAGTVYIVYNDGDYPLNNIVDAEVMITGNATSDLLGSAVVAGDFNADGKTDLVVGANGTNSSMGTVYAFYSQNGALNTNRNITGEAGSDIFGTALATGDLNADGRVDLVVGAPGYSAGGNDGRVYIFYNDGVMPTGAASADVIITGATSSQFGGALAVGDLNADSKTDLAVGAINGGTYGRTYIFYNDGSIPTTAATADVTIDGVVFNDNDFGRSLATGDLNADGEVDLIVGTYDSTFDQTGDIYIFYNDGSYSTTSSGRDVKITGTTSGDEFGITLATGDFNADGRTDLVAGAYPYSSSTGRAYVFNNDGSLPTTAATADAIITGETTTNYFGVSLAAGDFNADGKVDLVVGASRYSSDKGRAYIFYNGSITTENASGADVIIGETVASDSFGISVATADINTDGRMDLIVGAYGWNAAANDGRAYVFYNDGSIPTTAATADIILTGDIGDASKFGDNLTVGDLNADGKTDLIVSAGVYNTSQGRVYFYEGRDNYSWTLQRQLLGTSRISPSVMGEELRMTGETGNNSFGFTLGKGDFNADGKMDLVVGASPGSAAGGKVYIFYNDGNYTTNASSADLTIVATSTSEDEFGCALVTGDFDADGRVDLAVGARRYSFNGDTGRVWVFYNDGSMPTTTATADAIITGETTSNYLGASLTAGDFNADGKTDLVVGASAYSTDTGRVYIFYSGSITTENASGADIIITGTTSGDEFGITLTTGDLNADGKADLVVGATGYSSSTGRAYILYNDGSIPTAAASADVIIVGESAPNDFGISFATGDFNADGKGDLAVGAPIRLSVTGRAYVFYGDGSIPTTAATADVIITGEASGDQFGISLAAGDLNADGRIDLVAGANGYSTDTGRAYVFYNDGSYPSAASSADVFMTGETTSNDYGYSLVAADFSNDGRADLAVGAYSYSSNKGRAYLYTLNDTATAGGATGDQFGFSLISGDLNADGKTDLAAGAPGYSTDTGRTYVFYGGSALDISPSSADITITGEANSFFGLSLVIGDFNADGKTDLAAGAHGYSTDTGRAYIFYNGSIITEAATGADVIITGEASSLFGVSLTAGDLNADGETDLAVGAYAYSTLTGRAYIFYNDGSIPTTAATADVTITGEATNNLFGVAVATGDVNADGRVDIIVGASGYSTSTGRAYIFYNDGSIPTTAATADVTITGEASSGFSYASLTTGDLNADGKTDLAVGAGDYSTSTGRVYVFYNDGSIPTAAATADVIITGGAEADAFGQPLAAGDLNADGKTDLAVGATFYPAGDSTGRAYVFYNDGTYPSAAASADKMYTGESVDDIFGTSLNINDFNFDGIPDLVVGTAGYSTDTGRAYTFITEIATPPAASQTPDGNEITASVKGGTVKVKGGTIQVK